VAGQDDSCREVQGLGDDRDHGGPTRHDAGAPQRNPEQDRAVAAGEVIFGPAVSQRVLAFFSGTPPTPSNAFPELTDRERKILDLLAAGLSNAEIGQRLSLAAKTVANHVSSIFAKLQVAGRAQAIIKARDAGLGQP
jgi:DNA-binding NarL/FixJ family response regulator